MRIQKTVGALILLLVLIAPVAGQDRRQGPLTFDRYHDSRQTVRALERLARLHPRSMKLETIGKSGQGKDIHVAIVTDFSSGKADEKPGIFVEGNIHGNERVAGEAALFLIHQLLTRGKQDPQLSDLMRTRTFYVIPKSNPDAADAWVRGILKPDDEDGDGDEDEDGPEDVDGNGLVTDMRILDPDGHFIPGPDERFLVPIRSLSVKERRRYRGPRYRIMKEGIDNDDDGEVNEDGPDWEIDPNRDFPADLKMERKYRKKFARGGNIRSRSRPPKVKRGKKPPEKEFARCNEVQAIVKFLETHPSISLAVSFHSYGNALFRPFGYMPDKPVIPKEDLKRLNELGQLFKQTTGFQGYGPPYLGERQVVGGLHDYTYWNLGYPGITVEIWGVPGIGRDWADRGRRSDRNNRNNRGRRNRGDPTATRKILDYIDQENIKDACFPWTPFEHPTLGQVEIGGLWDRQRMTYNPPPSKLVSVIKPFVQFTLEATQMTPRVRILDVRSQPVKARVHRLDIEVMNVGNAPTTWKLAEKRKLSRPVTLHLDLPPGARLTTGKPVRDLGNLQVGTSVRVRWNVVLPEGRSTQTVVVTSRSEKGGVHRREIRLEPGAEAQ